MKAQIKPDKLRRYLADTSGLAAFEVALWLAMLAPVLLSVVDLGTYVFQRMQVENAAQMAAQAAWANCEAPPTGGCPNFAPAVAAAIQSTSLGANVTQDEDQFDEGYFCPDPEASPDAQTLTKFQTPVCASGAKAGYYVQVAVTYPYAPLFAGVSIAALLPTPIVQTAWSRLK